MFHNDLPTSLGIYLPSQLVSHLSAVKTCRLTGPAVRVPSKNQRLQPCVKCYFIGSRAFGSGEPSGGKAKVSHAAIFMSMGGPLPGNGLPGPFGIDYVSFQSSTSTLHLNLELTVALVKQ